MQEQIARQQKTAEAEADRLRKDMDRLRLQMSQLQNEANASAKTAEDARVGPNIMPQTVLERPTGIPLAGHAGETFYQPDNEHSICC